MDYKKYLLCYINENKAFFTRKPLDEQWGDDWNDRPYECNAGEPYEDTPGDIYAVYFEMGASCGSIQTPKDYPYTTYSVQEINSDKAPWITFNNYGDNGITEIEIPSGITLEDFEETLFKNGCTIYYPKAGAN